MSTLMANKILISVVVCTYNRSQSLGDTLNSLLILDYDGSFDYEIMIIDNNSKDKTKVIVESYMPKFLGRLRYVFEPIQGLSSARNRGIKEARGSIIAFTDDDVVVDKAWLCSILKCFQENNCDGIGGRIIPLYSSETPRWIKKHALLLNGPIVYRDHGIDVRPYSPATMLSFIGANMAFKKDCFHIYGLFRLDLGAGNGFLGEDTELFNKFYAHKLKLFYCGKAIVWHKVEKERSNYRYIAKWFFTSGRTALKEEWEELSKINFPCYWRVPRCFIRTVAEYFILVIFDIFERGKSLKNLNMAIWHMGRCYEFRRQKLSQQYNTQKKVNHENCICR